MFPPTGEYTWISGDGTNTVLNFTNMGGGRYEVRQITTESDKTRTSLIQTVDPPTTRTSTQITGRVNDISFPENGDDITYLVIDGNSTLPLNNIKQLRFSEGQDLSYANERISTNDRTVLADDVERLYFYDGFRFYQFDTNKINTLPGPGSLYLNPTFGIALYSTDSDFNSRFDGILAQLGSIDPDLEVVETPAPTTTPTVVSTDSPLPITTGTTPEPTTTTRTVVSTESPLPITTPGPTSNTPSVISTEVVVTLEPSTATPSTDATSTNPPTTDSTNEIPPITDESSDSSSEDSSCVESSETSETSVRSTRRREEEDFCDEESSRSKSESRNKKLDSDSSETSTLSKSSVSNDASTKSRKASRSEGRSYRRHHHSHLHRGTSKRTMNTTHGRGDSIRDGTGDSDISSSNSDASDHDTKSSSTDDRSVKTKKGSRRERRHSSHRHRHSGEPTKVSSSRSLVGRPEDDLGSNKKHCPAVHFHVKSKSRHHHHHDHHHHHHHHDHHDHQSHTHSDRDNVEHRHHDTHLHRDSSINSTSRSGTRVHDEDTSESSTKSSKSSRELSVNVASDSSTGSHSHVHNSRSRRFTDEAQTPCYGLPCYAISQAFSLLDSPRRTVRQQQRDPESLDLNLDTTTLDFQLVVDADVGSISLMHEGQQLINLTDSEEITLTDTLSYSYNDKNLVVTDRDGREIANFDDIQELFVFNGTLVGRSEGPIESTRALNGKLYVGDDQAFLSSSLELNNLIDEQLERIFPDTLRIMVEFETLADGNELLSIDGTNVLTLNGAEVTEVPEQSFIQYANNTVYVQDTVQGRLANIFPVILQLYVLNGVQPGLVGYNEVITNELPGEGSLYVHRPSGTGFYSRHVPINNAITQRINSLSIPDDGLVFSVRFEPQPNGESPFVTVVVDDEPLIQLNPADVDDQSIQPEQMIIYRNQTVMILVGDIVINDYKDVEELVFFDGKDLITFKESSPDVIPGGGQVFVSENQGFYSVDTVLNDRIGEALLAVEPATSDPVSMTTTPLATVPPPTTSDYYPTESTEAPLEGSRSIERSTNSPCEERKTPSHDHGSSKDSFPKSRKYQSIPRRSRPKSYRPCKGRSSTSSSSNTSVSLDDKSSDSNRSTSESSGSVPGEHRPRKQSTRKHSRKSSLTTSSQHPRKPSVLSSESITPSHAHRSSDLGDGSRVSLKERSTNPANEPRRGPSSVSQ